MTAESDKYTCSKRRSPRAGVHMLVDSKQQTERVIAFQAPRFSEKLEFDAKQTSWKEDY